MFCFLNYTNQNPQSRLFVTLSRPFKINFDLPISTFYIDCGKPQKANLNCHLSRVRDVITSNFQNSTQNPELAFLLLFPRMYYCYYYIDFNFFIVGLHIAERGCFYAEMEHEDLCSYFKRTEASGHFTSNYTCKLCDTTNCNNDNQLL